MLGCAVTILGDAGVCQRGGCILMRVVQGVPKQVATIILKAALGDKVFRAQVAKNGQKWPQIAKIGPKGPK